MFLALNSLRDCTDIVTVEFSIAFKLWQCRVNSSSNFATVTFSTVFAFQNVPASCERNLNETLSHSTRILHSLMVSTIPKIEKTLVFQHFSHSRDQMTNSPFLLWLIHRDVSIL